MSEQWLPSASDQEDMQHWSKESELLAGEPGAEIIALRARVAELERELTKWEQPFDADMLQEVKQQASHSDSLAAQGVYITALEHALKHIQQQLATVTAQFSEYRQRMGDEHE